MYSLKERATINLNYVNQQNKLEAEKQLIVMSEQITASLRQLLNYVDSDIIPFNIEPLTTTPVFSYKVLIEDLTLYIKIAINYELEFYIESPCIMCQRSKFLLVKNFLDIGLFYNNPEKLTTENEYYKHSCKYQETTFDTLLENKILQMKKRGLI